jgi:hypothetical protein
MNVFISMLMGALGLSMKSLLGKALTALGIGFVTYHGINLTINSIKADALSWLGHVPPQLIGAVGMLRLTESLSVICSAVLAKYVVMGLSNGSLTRMITK